MASEHNCAALCMNTEQCEAANYHHSTGLCELGTADEALLGEAPQADADAVHYSTLRCSWFTNLLCEQPCTYIIHCTCGIYTHVYLTGDFWYRCLAKQPHVTVDFTTYYPMRVMKKLYKVLLTFESKFIYYTEAVFPFHSAMLSVNRKVSGVIGHHWSLAINVIG